MYRGFIQEGNWVREGSYLRKVVKQYSMQNNFGRGRIWRLAHKDFTPGPQPHMLDETPAQLVKHLDHPNGWWRDTAQMLLVVTGDKSVVPALQAMARDDKNPLARIHALWTLEGLKSLASDLVREKLKDADPHVRVAAIRSGESLMTKGDTALVNDVRAMTKDSDPNVVLQVMLTAKLLNWPDNTKFIQYTMAATPASGVKSIGNLLLNAGHEFETKLYSGNEMASLRRGEVIYQELCFACHGFNGQGMPLDNPPNTTIAPPLGDAHDVLDHHDTIIRILLKGASGNVNGKPYTALMVPMETNNDQWIADVASYVRNSFGNHASLIGPEEVARLRAEYKSRTTPFTLDELHALAPRPVAKPGELKLTASNNSAEAHLASDGNFNNRWTSKADQVPGMWVQIELPTETQVAGLWIDPGKSYREYPRGYKVELSTDGHTWSKPVAQGNGKLGPLEISFKPAQAKYIRITQTGKLKGNEKKISWSIAELQVLAPSASVSSAR